MAGGKSAANAGTASAAQAAAGAKKAIAIPEGKVCDYIDGKFRDDTPEEYVRQTIEKRLINEHRYSAKQIRVEYALQLGPDGKKKADIVVFRGACAEPSLQTQENAWIVIECKKETVEPSSAKGGLAQLKSYMSACPNCEWGMWTNGKQKEVYRKALDASGRHAFEDFNDIPSADGNLEDIDRPKYASLKNASDDNLLFVFRSCHNHIYVNDGLQKQPAFFELLKVIFCKIEDERGVPELLEFYATSGERGNPDGQLTVKKRMSRIFSRVKKRHGRIFEPNEEILLAPRSLANVVSELQKYSLLNTSIDIKGKAYEEIVGANLRGDRGEFFTPRNVMKMVVGMLNPAVGERVLDSSCGTGGFLVNAMAHAVGELRGRFEREIGAKKDDWGNDARRAFQDRVSDMARADCFGFDINPDLVKAAKMNMVMNNDGSGNILQANSLLPPHEWPDDFKARLGEALGIDKAAIRNHGAIGHFDVIMTNPPFGSKIPVKDAGVLEQFELARIWEKGARGACAGGAGGSGAGAGAKAGSVAWTGRWAMTERLQSSAPPEILFIERCVQFLRPGGRLGIVLPDSILGSPGLGYVREWLVRNTRIVASIDLHADTFQPHNGTQTSVLVLQKKTQEQKDMEEKSGAMADYNIFMAMVEKVGHDKRGNPLFKRDMEGNEILAPDTGGALPLGATAHGGSTADGAATPLERKTKLLDDQTQDVPAIFAAWKRREGIAW